MLFHNAEILAWKLAFILLKNENFIPITDGFVANGLDDKVIVAVRLTGRPQIRQGKFMFAIEWSILTTGRMVEFPSPGTRLDKGITASCPSHIYKLIQGQCINASMLHMEQIRFSGPFGDYPAHVGASFHRKQSITIPSHDELAALAGSLTTLTAVASFPRVRLEQIRIMGDPSPQSGPGG